MTSTAEQWKTYVAAEQQKLAPVLSAHELTLDTDQPHLKGERFLQQAVTTTSGKKLILLGTTALGERVVIKATRDRAGQQELVHERRCREFLGRINFAAAAFKTPPEVAWIEADGFTVSVTAFIPQPRTFLEHSLPEQFTLALSAFTAQEGTHATTSGHIAQIRRVFALRGAREYLHNMRSFTELSSLLRPEDTAIETVLTEATNTLVENAVRIEQYCGFLTHTDFVPHNIRIDAHEQVYLLDHSSLTFGNKYEGWARFLNFMTLYHPTLASLLTNYVRDNRAPEESEALWLMRIYRLGEIILYYAKAHEASDGNLRELNRARITFWQSVLAATLQKAEVPAETIAAYQALRDQLRSPEEKARQRGLH